MSLRFYIGASGAGKSTALYREIIERSMKHPEQNFFLIVPDQFSMQTQAELVRLHPRKGIMNIWPTGSLKRWERMPGRCWMTRERAW